MSTLKVGDIKHESFTGTTQLKLDSAGNVGIGTTSPSGASGKVLEINGGSGQARIVLKNSTTGSASTDGHQIFSDGTTLGIQNREAGSTTFETNGSERMRIDSSGRLLVGTTDVGASGVDNLILNRSGNGGLTIRNGVNNNGNIFFSDGTSGAAEYAGYFQYQHAQDTLVIGTSGSERMRIDSSGKLLVGRTNNITITGDQTDHTFEQLISNQYAIGLHCNQQYQRGLGIYYTNGQNASDAIRFAIGSSAKFIVLSSGNVTNANNSYGQISDVSLKENIVDANSQWDDIKNLKIRNFNFKSSTGYDTHTQIGLVAQEVETVCPKLVDTGEDGIKRVTSSVLYMKAVKALQEAVAKIEVLETKVAALEAG